jgi:hypothetical protein
VDDAARLELRDLRERDADVAAQLGGGEAEPAGERTRSRVMVNRRHSLGAYQLNATCPE